MNRVELALTHFQEGYACSQTIFSSYAEQFGIDHEMAIQLATGFAGGVGHMADMCGAVSGAIMVLGLRYGGRDPEGRSVTAEKVQEFIRRFKERNNNTIVCRELLGYDISTPEGKAQGEREGRSVNTCPKFIQDAAEILEQLL